MSTLKQRKNKVKRAVEAMHEAADALGELQSICIEHAINVTQEEKFASELRERAEYWERCTWWQKEI